MEFSRELRECLLAIGTEVVIEQPLQLLLDYRYISCFGGVNFNEVGMGTACPRIANDVVPTARIWVEGAGIGIDRSAAE